MSDYNGWTNRETWLVNLHFNPETLSDVEYARDCLEELENSIEDIFLRDFVDFGRINWRELEEHVEENEDADEI